MRWVSISINTFSIQIKFISSKLFTAVACFDKKLISSTGYWTCVIEIRNVCKILVGNFEGNRPLGKHKLKMDDNIKMDLK
jgi:hypothetical protein